MAYESRDYASAIRELEPLAEQGDVRAQELVGLMYRDGQGVPQDFVRAHQWLNLAAAVGQAEAATARDELAERMERGQIAEAQRLAATWRPQSAAVPTPTAGTPAVPPPASSVDATLLNRVQTMDLQWQLAVHGYDPGPADGAVGPRTYAAIWQYQADAALPTDGVPTLALLDHLRFTEPPVRNARALADDARTSLAVTTATYSSGDDSAGYQTSSTADAEVWSQPPSSALSRIYVVTVQEALVAKGYRPGPIDGIAGRRTREAIRRYQNDHGLPVTGVVSQALVNHLRLIIGLPASYSASAG
ncbi:MAG: peptidoglycan-binding protein [Alphaproteobacteria bacterium]